MNPSTIYSKSGKGVQEASGKTSLLKRGDRAVLSAIDGRSTLTEVAQKVGKSLDAVFLQLIKQLDKDGFVREVAAGTSTTGSRPVPPRPAAKAPPPAAPAAGGGGAADLDFTSIIPALKPGQSLASAQKASDKAAEQRAKEQESALHKARQEAEARSQAEHDRVRTETEKKVREEAAAKLKAEADAKVNAEAKARAARDAEVRMAAEVKAKAEADAKARIDAERKAKEEVERKAKEEAERKAKEQAEKARKEAEELRQRLEEEERKAREAQERKRKEEEEARRRKEEEAARKRQEEEEARKRKEEEAARKRQEEEGRRAREEADRAAREQEEARRREEEDRRMREKEEQARAAERGREEEERRLEEEGRRREEEERVRKSTEETKMRQPTVAAPPSPAAMEAGPGSLDALMADLDSFSEREEQESSSRESAERKAREDKQRRAQEESERRAKEEADLERREAEDRRRKEDAQRRAQEEEQRRRAQEEAERRVREAEEQRRIEAEKRNREARESLSAKEVQPSAVPAATDDIGVTDDDLDMDDVRQDEAVVAKESRKQQREREREVKQREREARERAEAAARKEPVKYSRPRRPVKWGKPLAMTLFVLLLVGVGALHVVPLPMSDYENAASEALGRPVRIASGRLSLFTGVSLNLDRVTIGDGVKIATVRAYPRFGSLIDENKAFRRIELEGVSIPQQVLGETLFAKVQGKRFSVTRILVTKLNLAGPLPLPLLEADALLGLDGALRTVTLRGPDNLDVKLTPANAKVELDATASSFTLPFAPEVTLTSFAMKGTATRQGMNIAAWGGSILDGALSGTANMRWGSTWQVDGVVTVRGINAAVFAPALLSLGKAEATGKFSMSGAEPAKLARGTRIDGSFTVSKGVLGSFDLTRAIQTSGRQFAGRTQFVEMTGQGVYDRGAVALRDIVISAGALSAGASADIAQSGALNGRIVADVKTASQSLRQTLNLGGTMREPQVRN